MRRTGELSVRTPEGVTFSFRLASPLPRAFARAIDLVVVVLAWILLGFRLSFLELLSSTVALAIFIIVAFIVQQGYAIAFEYHWDGQTLGKRALGLRVMDENGFPPTFAQVVVRNLLRFADVLPLGYALGGTIAVLSPRLQRLGDLAAGTVVIRTEVAALPDPRRIRPDRFNSLRRHPAAVARLRQALSPAEARLAYRALLRRDELDPAERVRLFADLAAHIQEQVRLPAEATDNLSPEAFVRNAVDVLLERKG